MSSARNALALLAVTMPLAARAAAPDKRDTVADGTARDTQTQLTWQASLDDQTRTWSAASTYCAQLSLAGPGWRCPRWSC